MQKIAAKSLSDALLLASDELNRPLSEIDYEIVQHPRGGIFGLFSRDAIIIADIKQDRQANKGAHKDKYSAHKNSVHKDGRHTNKPCFLDEPLWQKSAYKSTQKSTYEGAHKEATQGLASEARMNLDALRAIEDPLMHIEVYDGARATALGHTYMPPDVDDIPRGDRRSLSHSMTQTTKPKASQSSQSIHQNNLKSAPNLAHYKDSPSEDIPHAQSQQGLHTHEEDKLAKGTRHTSPSHKGIKLQTSEEIRLALKAIEDDIKLWFTLLPYDIDTIEVSLHSEKTIYIYMDGKDSALLIGEKGYRYKALSYLLSNFIQSSYSLQIRLEIAHFLKNQEEMIDFYLKDIYALIDKNGHARTKVLDGILAYIALEKLRSAYKDKYICFREDDSGEKYILIDDFDDARR